MILNLLFDFSHIVGFGYPFYASLRSLESEGTRDDKQWYVGRPVQPFY